ncbi:MAG: Uma2 family endonuclease [Phormidesmis sp.]
MSAITAKRFTVDEYQQLAELGFLKASDRIELINGEIVYMAAKGVAHETYTTDLNEELVTCLKGIAKVRCQAPIALPPINAPEPDFTIVRTRLDRYMSGHPKSTDIFLVIEVSDSSITYDQTTKLSLYAENSIADYWIFNLLDAVLECYSGPYQDPHGKFAYRSKQIFLPTDAVTVPGLPKAQALSLEKVFPPSPQ